MCPPVNVYLVRHAQALGRGDWREPDASRPLSPKGCRQASGLVDLLGGEPIVRVAASPASRCQQTVGPLAAALGLEVESNPALVEGAPNKRTMALLAEVAAADGDVVLCSHGDVIPAVLSRLRTNGLRLRDELRWSKASTWVLVWDGTRFSQGRYLPPPG